MVEKRPKFTGPLVNSWPARLLFSLSSWDPKKCRNHYFCSIISFALTRPLKMDPQKRGSKNKSVDRAVSKKGPPPPAPLINSSFWTQQKIVFSIFRVLDFWPIFFSVLGFVCPRKIIRQISATLSGLPKKQGKARVFVELFLCFCKKNVISWFSIFSMWCPLCSCFPSCTFIVANV